MIVWATQSVSVFGSALTFFAITIWLTQTPRELQGRVFAVRRLIAQCTWPLSTTLAGGLFNPGLVVAVLGLILFFFCLAQLFNPYLLRVENKA